MIIPNIEEECSVENFSPDLKKDKLELSFSYSDNRNPDEGTGKTSENAKKTNTDPATAKASKNRPRMESIDKPVLGFNFEEQDYVETAQVFELESPSNDKIKNKFVTLKPILATCEESSSKIYEESEASSDIENMNKLSEKIFNFTNSVEQSGVQSKKLTQTKSLPNIKEMLESQEVDPEKIEEISRESDDDVPIATNDF